jgi:hypothetical protein
MAARGAPSTHGQPGSFEVEARKQRCLVEHGFFLRRIAGRRLRPQVIRLNLKIQPNG